MKVIDFLWILSGVLLNAAAQLLLKAGANSVGEISMSAGASALWRTATGLAMHPGILGGLACYAISVVVWVLALSRAPVSVVYPLLSLGYIVNAVGAAVFLGETFDSLKLLAIAVIILGVWLLTQSGT